jgi:hypothetical protein
MALEDAVGLRMVLAVRVRSNNIRRSLVFVNSLAVLGSSTGCPVHGMGKIGAGPPSAAEVGHAIYAGRGLPS